MIKLERFTNNNVSYKSIELKFNYLIKQLKSLGSGNLNGYHPHLTSVNVILQIVRCHITVQIWTKAMLGRSFTVANRPGY
jgi:hypothetical protein